MSMDVGREVEPVFCHLSESFTCNIKNKLRRFFVKFNKIWTRVAWDLTMSIPLSAFSLWIRSGRVKGTEYHLCPGQRLTCVVSFSKSSSESGYKMPPPSRKGISADCYLSNPRTDLRYKSIYTNTYQHIVNYLLNCEHSKTQYKNPVGRALAHKRF